MTKFDNKNLITKNQLQKYNTMIISIYFTPKNQMWGILNNEKKKCILRKVTNNTELDDFLKSKKIITYEESKLIKKVKSGFINDNATKNKCLGFTKKGVACGRLLSGNSKCFQHKSELYDVNASYKKSKDLDQFYTTEHNANLCTQLYSKFIGVNRDNDVIIEPSAGNGSFINNIDKLSKNVFLIDVDPKHSRIEVGDFLKFNKNLNTFKKVHVIGNPPFSIVNKFLKQAFKIADGIGFILPLSFRKESRQKVFPLNFHCIHERILLSNIFYFNGRVHKVPTMFQV